MLLLRGILALVFGLLILVIPRAGVLAVVWWIGTYAIFFGMAFTALAVRLRGWVSRETGSDGAR